MPAVHRAAPSSRSTGPRAHLPLAAAAASLALAAACSSAPSPGAAGHEVRSAAVLGAVALNFPDTPVSSLSDPQDWIVTNNTNQSAIMISGFDLSGDTTSFHVYGDRQTPFPLAVGASAVFHITFHPQAAGARSATLALRSDGGFPNPQSVVLTGNGLQGSLAIYSVDQNDGGVGSPLGRVDFGRELVPTASKPTPLVLRNDGTAPVAITAATDGDDPEHAFVLDLSGVSLAERYTLNPGDTLPFAVRFRPPTRGVKAGILSFASALCAPSVLVTGLGTTLTADATPSQLDFGAVQVGSNIGSYVYLNNSGDDGLILSGAEITCPDPSCEGSPFTLQGTLSGTVYTNYGWYDQVTFHPQAETQYTGYSVVFHTELGDVPIPLLGTGALPHLTISPATFDFGGQDVRLAPGSRRTTTLTLTNTGQLGATISSAGADNANFTFLTDAPPTSIDPAPIGGQTTVQVAVAFSPTQRGARTGNFTFTFVDGSGLSPVVAQLAGNGLAPVFGVDPAALAFGGVPVGDASASRTLTLANTGDVDLVVTGVALDTQGVGFAFSVPATPFAVNFGPASVQRAIGVKFAPAALGAVSANLVVTTDAGTFSIALSGTGIAQRFAFAPDPLALGQVLSGTSATSTVSVGNLGADPVTITGFTTSGADAQSFGAALAAGALPLTLAGGDTAPITVTFTAGPFGLRAATLAIASDDQAPGRPLALSAESVGPDLALQPTSLDFGAPAVGTTTDPKVVALKNTGKAPLTITAIGLIGGSAGRFAFTPAFTAPLLIAAGATAPISVTYHPTAVALDQATLHIASNGTNVSSGDISLSGEGTAPDLSATPLVLAFPPTRVGTLAQPLAVLITNRGGQPGSIGDLTATGSGAADFAPVARPTPSRLAAGGGSTQVLIAFTPSAVGERAATLSIDTDSGPVEVHLSGTGQGGALSVSSTSVDFGSVAAFGAPKTLALTVTNIGNGPLRLSFPRLDGPDAAAFSATILGSASSTLDLAEGQRQDVTLAFAPRTSGTLQASLHLTADTGEPLEVTLKGQGLSPKLSAAASVDFGTTLLGSAVRRTLDLTNPGTIASTVVGFETAAFAFTAAGNGLPLTVAPGATVTVGLEFVPTTEGKADTQLSIYIAGEDAAAAQVALTGTATKVKTTGCAGSPAPWLALLGVIPLFARRRRGLRGVNRG